MYFIERYEQLIEIEIEKLCWSDAKKNKTA